MTNIEFLVNELRKANETIDRLNKEIARLKAEIARLKAEIARRGKTIALDESCLGDIDALETLVKKFREM